ncbi:MAG: hypothetical protein LBL67_03110 [Coriobacteriales bacterium]|jgi:hypothetical protein|nr:hypothetical protein [Coriobacteriales bacterium]
MAQFCDISGLGKLRVSGEAANTFLQVMTTGDCDGPCLMLTSEAEVIDVVVVCATGPDEYMLTCDPANLDEVREWLVAHAALKDQRGLIFPGVAIEDATERLASFAIFPHQQADPVQVAAYAGIPCLMVQTALLPGGVGEYHFMPKYKQQMAEVLEADGLKQLSLERYIERRRAAHTWFDQAAEPRYYKVSELPQLRRLLRNKHNFVGGKLV